MNCCDKIILHCWPTLLVELHWDSVRTQCFVKWKLLNDSLDFVLCDMPTKLLILCNRKDQINTRQISKPSFVSHFHPHILEVIKYHLTNSFTASNNPPLVILELRDEIPRSSCNCWSMKESGIPVTCLQPVDARFLFPYKFMLSKDVVVPSQCTIQYALFSFSQSLILINNL